MDGRQFRIIALLLGFIGAALLALVLVLVFSGDGDEPAAAPSVNTTSTPAAPGTPGPAVTVPQPPPPTPAPPAITASPVPPTTIASPVTTTAAPPPTTTTSTTEPPPAPLVLQDDGIGGVSFGTDPDATIAYAESVLGPVENDTGWIDSFSKYGTCPGDVVRGAEWGVDGGGFGFVLLFTQSPTTHLPGGGPHLFGYLYFGEPAGLETEGGISIGSTLGDAQAAHPGSTVDEHPLVPGSGIWLFDSDPGDQALIWGFADGIGAGDTLSSINGGSTCGE